MSERYSIVCMPFLKYLLIGNLGVLYVSYQCCYEHWGATIQFSSVQSLKRVRLFVTPWTAGHQASLSITNTQILFKDIYITMVMPSNHLILCHPLLPPSIFPSIRVFPVNQLFTSDGQSIGVSASALVLPMNIQDWFPLKWTAWVSSLSKGLSRVFANTRFPKSINSSALSFLYSPILTSIHDYWENHSFDFVGKEMSLLFNMLSRLVITFLPRSKHLLISWLQSPSAVIL